MDCYIGIDVAKATLDIAVLPSGESWTITNDDAGLHELVPRVLGLAPTLVVLEATGGFESPAVAALAKAGLPVVVAILARLTRRHRALEAHPCTSKATSRSTRPAIAYGRS